MKEFYLDSLEKLEYNQAIAHYTKVIKLRDNKGFPLGDKIAHLGNVKILIFGRSTFLVYDK
ncbi:hypothetical protein C7H19_07285 [Aphanothece hegewaldii CCALA 016]|uniref:Uncharacterized protein n=1 Tax=Aphanothece hegewaldii CCALA 016 TaxID=2107694 RepID=A0A2T1M0S7_9CHRO|nr:hypothetical protein C7H19_07285 [Aphanothece hegewaldii CCALA 016]